jgi:excisionase family DNA binding protein
MAHIGPHTHSGEAMARDLSDVRFLTVAEVAEMMRVSTMTVYRLVHSGELPAVRFGRSYRIPESAVVGLVGLADSDAQAG